MLDDRPGVTRSEAERRFLALLHRARLSAPRTNVRLAAGYRTLRVTWRDLTERSEPVAVRLAGLLRPAPPPPLCGGG